MSRDGLGYCICTFLYWNGFRLFFLILEYCAPRDKGRIFIANPLHTKFRKVMRDIIQNRRKPLKTVGVIGNGFVGESQAFAF